MDEELQKHIYADAARLDRIEAKIDKLSDTVVAIARAEEKLLNLEVQKREIVDRLDNHEERLDRHSERLNSGAVTLNSIQRIFWIGVAVLLAVAAEVYLK